MKINSFRLLVQNFDECFKFYSQTLGLTTTWGEPGSGYASFATSSSTTGLSIFESDLMAEAIGNSDQPLPSGCREKFTIEINVDDVDKIYTELSAKGIEFINSPKDMNRWGIRTVHLRDPEGNLIELSSMLDLEKWDKNLQDDLKKYDANF